MLGLESEDELEKLALEQLQPKHLSQALPERYLNATGGYLFVTKSEHFRAAPAAHANTTGTDTTIICGRTTATCILQQFSEMQRMSITKRCNHVINEIS